MAGRRGRRRRGDPPAGAAGVTIDNGLGIYALDLPCGRFWGHDGGVFGMATQSLSSPDGERQLSFGMNWTKYQHLDDNGNVEPSPIDFALVDHLLLAVCGQSGARAAQTPLVLFPTGGLSVKR